MGFKKLVYASFIACLILATDARYNEDFRNTDSSEDVDEYSPLYQAEEVEPEHDEPKLCKTAACMSLKTSLLSKMDTTYHPCADMYMYSCGGMIKRESHKKLKQDSSTFGDLIDAQRIKLRKIIEGLKDRKEHDVYRKVYDWYSACSNTAEKKKIGASPLLKILKSLGNWPRLNEEWTEVDWDLEKTLALVHRKLSVFPLFKISVDFNATNVSSHYRLSIQKPSLALEASEFYLKQTKYSDKILFAYFKLLVQLTRLLETEHKYPGEMSLADAEDSLDLMDDMLEIVKLEIAIAKAITLDKKQYLSSPYTTLGELQKTFGDHVFDWKRYISLLYQDLPKQPPFEDSEIIYIGQVKFFKQLMVLIANTDRRLLANYILTKVIYDYGGSLSPNYRAPYLEFYSVAYGLKAFSKLWQRCVRSTSENLMFPVTALFVKENLPEKDLQKAESLVNRLTEAYLYHMDQVQWMDDKTRRAAKEKIKAMLPHVGYPREIRNTTVLDEIYSDVKVNPLKYFDNVYRLSQLKREHSLNERGAVPKRNGWNMKLTDANAEYSPNWNKLTVAAGLLQPPLFHHDYPRACTYGSIGMAIGHEMTHGFDAYGAQFDKQGNAKLWWTKETYKTFVNKTKCMVKQYSKFKVYNQHLNGKQTLDENIADNGGLRIAYEAYCKSLKADGPDLTLPGIKQTSKQLFFLSYGQLWCKHKTKASSINSLHTDEHSPARARVNLVLQNMKEFSAIFSCPKGSPMNPEKKCIVW